MIRLSKKLNKSKINRSRLGQKGVWVLLVFFFCYGGYLFSRNKKINQPKACIKFSKQADKGFKRAKKIKDKILKYKRLKENIKEYPKHLPSLYLLAQINEDLAIKSLDKKSFNKFEIRKLNYYLKILETCPTYKYGEVLYKTGLYYFSRRDFLRARKMFTDLINFEGTSERNILESRKKINYIKEYYMIKQTPVAYKPKKVLSVSTKDKSEFLPFLSPDNRFLFFTRRTKYGSRSSFASGTEKDIFFKSRKLSSSRFSSGIPMPAPFNKGKYQGAASMTIDNKTLFITVVEVIPYPCIDKVDRSILKDESLRPSFENADIFYSEYIDGKWGELKSIGSHINTRCTWESMPSISADGNVLYFTRSMEPLNYGDLDIYKVEKLPNGKWGKPINIGPPINTDGDEKSPFIHSDSKTIYFSSNKHPGIGGYDVFFSKIDDKTNNFSTPKNIGYPINNERDQHGFVIDRNGARAYFSSDFDSKNNSDIYSFSLPEKSKPNKVIFIRGKVLAENKKPLEKLDIKVYNSTEKSSFKGVYDKSTGEYVVALRAKKNDSLVVNLNSENHIIKTKVFKLRKDYLSLKDRTENLIKIKKGAVQNVQGIVFATNSYQLSGKAKLILDQFSSFLLINKKVKVEINGHTDNLGNKKNNLLLSLNRSKSVKQYLEKKGIKSKRMKAQGFGASKPIASNNTAKGRAKNRRIEFVVFDY